MYFNSDNGLSASHDQPRVQAESLVAGPRGESGPSANPGAGSGQDSTGQLTRVIGVGGREQGEGADERRLPPPLTPEPRLDLLGRKPREGGDSKAPTGADQPRPAPQPLRPLGQAPPASANPADGEAPAQEPPASNQPRSSDRAERRQVSSQKKTQEAEEQRTVQKLQQRDAQVRAHEGAHLAVAGAYAAGGPSYSYQTGPDGKQYAVGGSVPIDLSPIPGNPGATAAKAAQVRAAALAPADPSGADQAIAAAASAMETRARARMVKEAGDRVDEARLRAEEANARARQAADEAQKATKRPKPAAPPPRAPAPVSTPLPRPEPLGSAGADEREAVGVGNVDGARPTGSVSGAEKPDAATAVGLAQPQENGAAAGSESIGSVSPQANDSGAAESLEAVERQRRRSRFERQLGAFSEAVSGGPSRSTLKCAECDASH